MTNEDEPTGAWRPASDLPPDLTGNDSDGDMTQAVPPVAPPSTDEGTNAYEDNGPAGGDATPPNGYFIPAPPMPSNQAPYERFEEEPEEAAQTKTAVYLLLGLLLAVVVIGGLVFALGNDDSDPSMTTVDTTTSSSTSTSTSTTAPPTTVPPTTVPPTTVPPTTAPPTTVPPTTVPPTTVPPTTVPPTTVPPTTVPPTTVPATTAP